MPVPNSINHPTILSTYSHTGEKHKSHTGTSTSMLTPYSEAHRFLASICHTYLSTSFPSSKPPTIPWLLQHLPHSMDDAVYLALLLVQRYKESTISTHAKQPPSDRISKRPKLMIGARTSPHTPNTPTNTNDSPFQHLLDTLSHPSLFTTLLFVSSSTLIASPEDLIIDDTCISKWSEAYHLKGNEADFTRVRSAVREVYEEMGWADVRTPESWKRLFTDLAQFKRRLRREFGGLDREELELFGEEDNGMFGSRL